MSITIGPLAKRKTLRINRKAKHKKLRSHRSTQFSAISNYGKTHDYLDTAGKRGYNPRQSGMIFCSLSNCLHIFRFYHSKVGAGRSRCSYKTQQRKTGIKQRMGNQMALSITESYLTFTRVTIKMYQNIFFLSTNFLS